MDIEAWPFLISQNRRFGYRSVVVPDFLLEKNATRLLMRATGANLTESDIPNYREIHNFLVGDITLVYRVIFAKKQHIGLPGDSLLGDSVGRPIPLIEGIVLRGRQPDIVITENELQEAHKQVEPAFRVFWDARDNMPPIAPSQPLNMKTKSSNGKALPIRKEPALELDIASPPDKAVDPLPAYDSISDLQAKGNSEDVKPALTRRIFLFFRRAFQKIFFSKN